MKTAPAPQNAFGSLLQLILPPSLEDEDVNVFENEELLGLFPPSLMRPRSARVITNKVLREVSCQPSISKNRTSHSYNSSPPSPAAAAIDL